MIFLKDILKDRVAIVTGGGSGIGFECARQLGRFGAKVVLFGRREAVLQGAVDLLRREAIDAVYEAGDVRKESDSARVIAKAVSSFGHLDTLVNAAAGNFLAVAEDLSPKGFRTVMEIDAVGVYTMCHSAFPELKRSGRGKIINISATLHYGATWYQTHACAAKAAIDAITRNLALEWGEYGITVNGIAPGPIANTPGFSKLGGGLAGDPSDAATQTAVSDGMRELIPLRYLGTTEDIATSVVFLCSAGGRNITGQTLINDGGHWLQKPSLLPRDLVRGFSTRVEAKSRTVGLANESNTGPTVHSRL